MKRRTALVTGGAGFIGSHLSRALVGDGWRVRIIDNLSSGSLSNIADIRKKITFIRADIRYEKKLKSAMKGADCVFHLAAFVSVPGSFKNPEEVYSINAEGTRAVLEGAISENVPRVIYTSSCAVYGETRQKTPVKESDDARPASPYALSKWLGGRYALAYNLLYGLNTLTLRLFNVYGPGQSPQAQYASVVPAFAKALLTGKKPVIYGTGHQTRDFVYVGDVVRSCVLAAKAKNGGGEFLNIASGKSVSVRTILRKMSRIAGKKPTPIYSPARTGDILHIRASVARAERILKFRPRVGLDRGLKETILWTKRTL